MQLPILTPTDFIAIANQTLEYAFGVAQIEGELANFRISKNKWVYFDIKDEYAKVSCFASVYALPGPLEEGMLVRVSGTPRLHPQFGFSVTVQSIQPSGEGALKKAFDLLKAKLLAEGLFDVSRKRTLPYPPRRIALVTSFESAAYADFIKIITARWPFVHIDLYDVQVQGEPAPMQLANAIASANAEGDVADVLVVTRGGGSADDLAAFNDERVVRAIGASRIPSLVAIGHEIDESLAELAADVRASTPSNAVELLVPDRTAELAAIKQLDARLKTSIKSVVTTEVQDLALVRAAFAYRLRNVTTELRHNLDAAKSLLQAYNPQNVLRRGYALVRLDNGTLVTAASDVIIGNTIHVDVAHGRLDATVTRIESKE